MEISYQRKTEKERVKYLKSRFLHLFIIYIVWSLLYFFYLADWQPLTLKKIITTHFAGYGWSGQYFFIILFQLIFLYPVLRFLYSIKVVRYLVLALILAIYFIWAYYYTFLPAFIKKIDDLPFIFWVPYVFAGITLAKENTKNVNIFFVSLLLLIPIEAYILDYYTLYHSAYLTPVVLLSSILFCFAVFQKKIILEQSKFSNLISYIGRNTMTIFVANPIIILILKTLIPQNIFGPPSLLFEIIFPLLSTVIIFCICLLVAEILKKMKLNGIIN